MPEVVKMCRNIKRLFNVTPPVGNEEIREAALQFVRKVSGFNSPSAVNQPPFNLAVDEITGVISELLASLTTSAPPVDREAEAVRTHAKAVIRFGR
jgi:hypothetical protein